MRRKTVMVKEKQMVEVEEEEEKKGNKRKARRGEGRVRQVGCIEPSCTKEYASPSPSL